MSFLSISIKKPNYKIPNALLVIQQVLTVCITVTGLVYCFVLIPGYYASGVEVSPDYTPFNFAAVLLHMVVPILAVIDFFMFTRDCTFKKSYCFYAGIPTVYYFIFSIIGFIQNWDFGDGKNYPYFFLNYNSPAGIFGFSSVMPYFMGSFYWCVILVGIIFGLSLLYIVLINKLINKTKAKL